MVMVQAVRNTILPFCQYSSSDRTFSLLTPPPPLLCVQMTTFFPHSTSSCNITLYRCCCIGCIVGIIIIIINPLTARVVGAPQMILQSVFSIFPVLHCPLGLAELQACPFPDVVFPTLPLSALSSSLFHCALQDLMKGRHDHTTAVCISLRRSGLCVVQLPAGSWHGLPRW